MRLFTSNAFAILGLSFFASRLSHQAIAESPSCGRLFGSGLTTGKGPAAACAPPPLQASIVA